MKHIKKFNEENDNHWDDDLEIEKGDLIKVNMKFENLIGVGFVYSEPEESNHLIVDLSWQTGGSTECMEISELLENPHTEIEVITHSVI